MRKGAEVSTIATVHPSKPLESFLFGFGCLGGGAARVDRDALYVGYMIPEELLAEFLCHVICIIIMYNIIIPAVKFHLIFLVLAEVKSTVRSLI